MNYEQWRNELFGQSPDIDPVSYEHTPEFYAVPSDQAFDFVDRVLVDSEVHSLFCKDQLGNGIHTIYSNCCSDLPFLYTMECREDRRVQGINNLANLYKNYFEVYCTGAVDRIGYCQDGPMGFICYMFWDVFVLYPGNATSPMISAAIKVMRSALYSYSDNCIASAIHGLGHWAPDVPEAITVLKAWRRNPTTTNSEILEYAGRATTGMIQ